jgi:hypothetical protein
MLSFLSSFTAYAQLIELQQDFLLCEELSHHRVHLCNFQLDTAPVKIVETQATSSDRCRV